jgi:hypothetical protein
MEVLASPCLVAGRLRWPALPEKSASAMSWRSINSRASQDGRVNCLLLKLLAEVRLL